MIKLKGAIKENKNKKYKPAMVELSHPTSRFPSVAAVATITTSLIVFYWLM